MGYPLSSNLVLASPIYTPLTPHIIEWQCRKATPMSSLDAWVKMIPQQHQCQSKHQCILYCQRRMLLQPRVMSPSASWCLRFFSLHQFCKSTRCCLPKTMHDTPYLQQGWVIERMLLQLLPHPSINKYPLQYRPLLSHAPDSIACLFICWGIRITVRYPQTSSNSAYSRPFVMGLKLDGGVPAEQPHMVLSIVCGCGVNQLEGFKWHLMFCCRGVSCE